MSCILRQLHRIIHCHACVDIEGFGMFNKNGRYFLIETKAVVIIMSDIQKLGEISQLSSNTSSTAGDSRTNSCARPCPVGWSPVSKACGRGFDSLLDIQCSIILIIISPLNLAVSVDLVLSRFAKILNQIYHLKLFTAPW